jgi:hypothetical protein
MFGYVHIDWAGTGTSSAAYTTYGIKSFGHVCEFVHQTLTPTLSLIFTGIMARRM